ncbi:hypothetical protein HanRHA438_Chr09g0379351 [Helianthus annuus]|nr:hypothetical protein HanRHA438_Chr09g0379351 [Helianthus annuus]
MTLVIETGGKPVSTDNLFTNISELEFNISIQLTNRVRFWLGYTIKAEGKDNTFCKEGKKRTHNIVVRRYSFG